MMFAKECSGEFRETIIDLSKIYNDVKTLEEENERLRKNYDSLKKHSEKLREDYEAKNEALRTKLRGAVPIAYLNMAEKVIIRMAVGYDVDIREIERMETTMSHLREVGYEWKI